MLHVVSLKWKSIHRIGYDKCDTKAGTRIRTNGARKSWMFKESMDRLHVEGLVTDSQAFYCIVYHDNGDTVCYSFLTLNLNS